MTLLETHLAILTGLNKHCLTSSGISLLGTSLGEGNQAILTVEAFMSPLQQEKDVTPLSLQ